MSKINLTALFSSVAVVVGALGAIATPAQAGTMHNGWNYSIDAFNDGSGGSSYEIKGLASKETDDSIFFAINGGTPLGGVYNNNSADDNTGWGDLFLNFSGEDFQSALGSESLLGVRFAETNDSEVGEVGVYNNISAKRVTLDNNGYKHLDHYYNSGFNKDNTYGTDLATKAEAKDYLEGNERKFLNVMDEGNYLGGITNLAAGELDGLDFANFNASGSETFGFKLDKSMLEGVLPGGITDYMAHVILECGNDGVALAGEFDIPEEEDTDVPEPAALLGLGSLGLLLVKGRKQQ
ncbi:MAG: PEP-CTERM sorting domain-containing protein [Kamptonema sp. SIO4C4]|nr:PEP-CTERM sorting domain-containing protein [Kamptonema sp. SIO4C4]